MKIESVIETRKSSLAVHARLFLIKSFLRLISDARFKRVYLITRSRMFITYFIKRRFVLIQISWSNSWSDEILIPNIFRFGNIFAKNEKVQRMKERIIRKSRNLHITT